MKTYNIEVRLTHEQLVKLDDCKAAMVDLAVDVLREKLMVEDCTFIAEETMAPVLQLRVEIGPVSTVVAKLGPEGETRMSEFIGTSSY